MLNLKYIFGAMVMGMLLVGCGNGISDAALQATGLKGAPKWVVNGGDGLYSGIGDAPIIANNVQFARTEALAAARAEVAKQIEVKIDSYLQKSQQRQNTLVQEDVKNKIGEIAKMNLINSKPSAFWITEDGKRAYVLVKLEENVVQEIRKKLEEQKIDVQALEKFESSAQ